jgi:hypothetical protein
VVAEKITANLPYRSGGGRDKTLKARRREQWGLVVFLGLILIIGYGSLIQNGGEIFPFFSWSMFGLVPQRGPNYTLRFVELPGHPLARPLRLQEADGLMPGTHSVVAANLILFWGRALDAGQPEEAERWHRQLETIFIPVNARYQLVRDFGDPVERWKNTPRPETVLGEWTRKP